MRPAFLPVNIKQRIPNLNLSDSENPVAYVKYISTRFDWVWYIFEYDGNDIFYGVTNIDNSWEFGRFFRSDLENYKGTHGTIERDCDFRNTTLNNLNIIIS